MFTITFMFNNAIMLQDITPGFFCLVKPIFRLEWVMYYRTYYLQDEKKDFKTKMPGSRLLRLLLVKRRGISGSSITALSIYRIPCVSINRVVYNFTIAGAWGH